MKGINIAKLNTNSVSPLLKSCIVQYIKSTHYEIAKEQISKT